ncbi:hypothetical protein H8N03_22790 [Ramlibacter sp. USB13]|uniref:Uncharacterized protein n=1 Tax=Ramlibacter cellulosilyticus TaxID=2764187 RepID=A0A923SD99_9BURK|nr:hypothetical protein [Ramlibacter cellulosilyticus]MBC5785785.1 hypothetical protein [Ramlibacter cellulosilyticus]
MSKKVEAATTAENEVQIMIEDEAELTPKELAQERQAALEAQKRRAWLTQTAEELAGRIPVSVFAMGSLAEPA